MTSNHQNHNYYILNKNNTTKKNHSIGLSNKKTSHKSLKKNMLNKIEGNSNVN
jgi:hypothetical protein